MFSIFTLAIKFLTIFRSFLYLLVLFSRNYPPLISKDVLNHYLIFSSAFNGLKSAKNVVFFSFCILFDMPMRGAIAPPLATLLNLTPYHRQLCISELCAIVKADFVKFFENFKFSLPTTEVLTTTAPAWPTSNILANSFSIAQIIMYNKQ